MAFLGLDLGSTFIKAGILDADRFVLSNIRRVAFPQPISGLGPLRCEFDPPSVLEAVRELIRQIVEPVTDIEGVVLCSQMSCMVLLDRRAGVLSNCLGWRDGRALEPHPSGTGSYYDVLQTQLSREQRGELGNELPTGCPLSFLFWYSEQKLLDPEAIPTSLPDFVLTNLCGSHSGVDATNAMAYELLRLDRIEWHREVLEDLGLAEIRLPDLRREGDIVGFLILNGKRVPCYTPVGDYQCALVGSLLQEGELSLNISTGSQVSRLTKSLELGGYQTRPFFGGKFVNTISHLPAGRSLDVLLRLVTELADTQQSGAERSWVYISEAVNAIEQTDLKVDLGFFPGPCGDRGSISNVHEKNLTVGSLFKAAFENMAQNYLECALRIWPERAWRNLVFSGGLARKVEPLRRAIQERFSTPFRICPHEEDTLLGLLILARAFSRRNRSVEEAMNAAREHYCFNTEREAASSCPK